MRLKHRLGAALFAVAFAATVAGPAAAQPYPDTLASAERGDTRAQFMLALIYDTGDGVPRDYDAALMWFRRAAEGGYDVAQAKLGLMYLFGWAVPRDAAAAAGWYRKAADQGHVAAQVRLARLHANGVGVERDLAEAYLWASLAAWQGDALAAWLRDRYARRMAQAEIAAAETRLRAWRRSR